MPTTRLGPWMPTMQRDLRYGDVVVGNTPANVAVIACFTHTIVDGIVHFDAACSVPSTDATIVSWSWDFGDSSTSTTGPLVNHTYGDVGIYSVTLIVTDSNGIVSPPYVDTVGIGYDDILEAVIGAIWFAPLDALNMPDWLTYTEGIANDMINTGWGDIYAEEWTDEYLAMEWPTFANAILDDATSNLGNYWTLAYWNQSAQPTYNDLLQNTIGAVWFAPLNALNSALPYGGTITTPGDGYRYHTFTPTTNTELGYFVGTSYGVTCDTIYVGGGGAGGRFGSGNVGGGGAGGQVVRTDGDTVTSQALVTVGAGGVGSSTSAGGNTTFGAGTASGGPNGNNAGVINGINGVNGSGGGGSQVPASGTGGTGSSGRNGGNGAGSVTAANNRGGGGAGAGTAGGNATVSGATGTGGDGAAAWFNGIQYGAGGGGGKASQAGGAGGGGTGSAGTGNTTGGNATAGRGAGGGGGGGTSAGGNGSDGIAIVRYVYP